MKSSRCAPSCKGDLRLPSSLWASAVRHSYEKAIRYQTPTRVTYDSGNYEAALDHTLSTVFSYPCSISAMSFLVVSIASGETETLVIPHLISFFTMSGYWEAA